jgi:hypothetical protein
MRLLSLFLCAALWIGHQHARGQEKKIDTVNNFIVKVPEYKRFYVGNGLDFAMLSTAIVSKPGSNTQLTMPRFTAVVNFGITLNYDLNNRIGLMSGLGIRNMGFIEKSGSSTIKRRVYSFGVPLGIKIGDLRNRNFTFFGGGADFPFHYKEKGFQKRSEKMVESNWFGDQTPRVLPFIFAGYSFDPGVTLKLQYYPTNFLNTAFQEADIHGDFYRPYQGYKVHLLLLSLGIDIHYNQWRVQEREYQEMKRERQQQTKLL